MCILLVYGLEDTVEITNKNVENEYLRNVMNSVENLLECTDNIQTNMELRGNRKRPRDLMRSDNSPEKEWHTVTRRHKVVWISNEDMENFIQISVTCNEDLPKQVKLAQILSENQLKGIDRVKYVHRNKLLVTFDSVVSCEEFLQCKAALLDLEWRLQKTSEVDISYGTIKNIEVDLAEGDILKRL